MLEIFRVVMRYGVWKVQTDIVVESGSEDLLYLYVFERDGYFFDDAYYFGEGVQVDENRRVSFESHEEATSVISIGFALLLEEVGEGEIVGGKGVVMLEYFVYFLPVDILRLHLINN